MEFILPVITLVLCGLSFYMFIRDLKSNPIDNEETNKVIFSKSVLAYSIIMILLTVAISFVFCTVYKENNLLTSIKRLSLLCMLWPIAYIDFKSYRIPNSFIIMGLIFRAAIFPFELIFQSELVWWSLLSEVIAAVALLLAAFLCSICMKGSIGFGDMKLFVVMGLLLSLDGIWSAIFLSLVVSFFVSAYLLITKKKSRKDAIPFGPAIVIGTFLSVCLSGM